MAELALRQHGVVARRQLYGLGLGRRAIDGRVERGRLHRVHRGVYAVGHRGLSSDGHVMAAVLAGGEGAVVSHRSAGALWGVCADRATAVEITMPVTRRDRSVIVQHQATIARDEQTTVRRIPVTTAFRTLLDLAAVLDARQLRRAVHEAEVLGLRDEVSLGQLIERHRGRRGVATLRAVLGDATLGAHITRSELELRFLELVADARLPPPGANATFTVAGRPVEIDFAWPDYRLAVELDGHATHATRKGFERDRERDRALQAAGWRVVRVTWRQLHGAPGAVVADLRVLLGVALRRETDRLCAGELLNAGGRFGVAGTVLQAGTGLTSMRATWAKTGWCLTRGVPTCFHSPRETHRFWWRRMAWLPGGDPCRMKEREMQRGEESH